jgi:outer membrane protein
LRLTSGDLRLRDGDAFFPAAALGEWMSRRRGHLACRVLVATALACAVLPDRATADTLESALAQAYLNNPQLNAQRALVRATDEGVPQALAGYRPRVSATANIAAQANNVVTRPTPTNPVASAPDTTQSGGTTPRGFGATLTQNLFNGFQTANRTRQAESQVRAARETLRATEQSVLLNAVIAYMNLLRDTAIFELQRSNVEVLQEQLRQTKQRLESGNVTATDVYQAEARLSVGRSQLYVAEANYRTARAAYRQVIGVDPARLQPASSVDRLFPQTLNAAIALSVLEHPAVATAQNNVDIALYQVKIAEGALYPTLNVLGSVQKSYDVALTTPETFAASIGTQLSVPIYQGGAEYSQIRQAKETLGQRRHDLDVARDQVRLSVTQAWAQLDAAKGTIASAQAQVKAAEAALNGVREEARLGQRTTLDVLNAQQELVNARIALVTAQRDRVVNSYSVLGAVGRLSPAILKLPVATYDAQTHYHQVRDAWIGLRTPDGR